MHEIYAHPFLKSVMAGVGSLMCSYSKCAFCHVPYLTEFVLFLFWLLDLVNGTYSCENDKVLNDIIKREYGFQGCRWLCALYPILKLTIDN